ncbi:recombination protein RecR, partial [Candidatus Aerophobetes bacterium]|nr:recombination protein RecR [Candidatus Aerophobetes bacterium]
MDKLIGELNKLPGIGEKTAERLSFFILKNSRENVERLADSLREVKEKVRFCSVCGNITEDDPCRICKDETRDRATICVVEHPQDLFLLERVRQYRGLYHVLGGAISPLKGVGPEDVNIGSLLKRVKQGKVTEIILATDPNTEGEATAIYISKLISP